MEETLRDEVWVEAGGKQYEEKIRIRQYFISKRGRKSERESMHGWRQDCCEDITIPHEKKRNKDNC